MAKSEACAEPKDQKSDILALFFFFALLLHFLHPLENEALELDFRVAHWYAHSCLLDCHLARLWII